MLVYFKSIYLKVLYHLLMIVLIDCYLVVMDNISFIKDLLLLDLMILGLLLVVLIVDYQKYQKTTKLLKQKIISSKQLESMYPSYVVALIKKNETYFQTTRQHLEKLNAYINKWIPEVKWLLTGILLANEKNNNNKKEMRLQLEQMQVSLNMLSLCNRLNDLNLMIKNEHIRLNQVINEALKHYVYFIKDYQFAIENDFEDMYVVSDRRLLTSLMEQFIFNAIKNSNQEPKLRFDKIGNGLIIEDNGSNVSNDMIDHELYFINELAKRLDIEIKVAQITNGNSYYLKFNKKDNKILSK